MHRKLLFILFIIFLSPQFLRAQKDTPADKSVVAKKDSAAFYRKLEKYAKKRKYTKMVYDMVFNPIEVPKSQRVKNKAKRVKQKSYRSYEGKTISSIKIVTLDPFGYDVTDTSKIPDTKIKKTGNDLHKKTLNLTIRNLLLTRKGKPFDSLLVKESERLIRSQKYVRDVAFFIEKSGKDSVEILIRVQDTWSITPEASLSGSSFFIGAVDNNFLGLGHEFHNSYGRYYTDGKSAVESNYIIPNIKNTYISTNVKYAVAQDNSYIKSVDVERPFYSAYAKWAGGVYIGQQLIRDSIHLQPEPLPQYYQNFRYNFEDYWLGKAWQISKSETEDARSTNLVLAGRYYKVRYLESPVASYDSLSIYHSQDLYLMGIGVSTRKYVQDRYVFKYGFIEDVPIGKTYGILAGVQHKLTNRLYIGVHASYGNYYEWGYLSSTVEYGTFINSSKFEQGVFTTSFNYYTPLFEFGKWKVRQFIKPLIMIGINRYPTDQLTINNEFGIRGFNAEKELVGMHKIVFTFQTQSYSPWRFLGFSLGPYFVASFGVLGNEQSGFRNSKLYSQIGVGVLLKNDYLIFNSFQLSFAYYPVIPGVGNNVLKVNPYSTSDFGFRDFNLSKPEPVKYQ